MFNRKHDEASHSPDPPTELPGVPTPTPPEILRKRLPVRPFIRIGNICVHIDRIASIEFLPEASLYRVGEYIGYGEHTAEREAVLLEKPIEKFSAPVVVVNYVMSNDMKSMVRRWGDEAMEIWNYITDTLASP